MDVIVVILSCVRAECVVYVSELFFFFLRVLAVERVERVGFVLCCPCLLSLFRFLCSIISL